MEVISQLHVPGPQCSAGESTHFSHRIGGLVGPRAILTALEGRVTLSVLGIELGFLGVPDDIHVTVQTIVCTSYR